MNEHIVNLLLEVRGKLQTDKMEMLGQLHDLEDCGMINREVIPEKPPKTIYSLDFTGLCNYVRQSQI